MATDGTFDFRLAPYRLLSDADLQRVLHGAPLFVVERACALREIERREVVARGIVGQVSNN